jgi:opacity protein-like surface antigen
MAAAATNGILSEDMEACLMMRAVVWAVVLAAALAPPALAADKPEDLAQAAAESWLKLTDAGDAAGSWDQAARLFKGAVTKEQWAQALASVRPPLGKVVSRKVLTRQYSEKVPGAPDGKYVTIQYQTAFANKAEAVETITPMLDPDGVWRVSGYFVR